MSIFYQIFINTEIHSEIQPNAWSAAKFFCSRKFASYMTLCTAEDRVRFYARKAANSWQRIKHSYSSRHIVPRVQSTMRISDDNFG